MWHDQDVEPPVLFKPTLSCTASIECDSVSVGLTSFSSIASKQATLEGPAVSTVKKAVKLYQVTDATGFPVHTFCSTHS